jgi:hypothetical protein
VTQIFHNGQPSHAGDRRIFEVMTSTLSNGTLGSVASLLAATLYHGNRFVSRLTRRVPLVEQELLTLPEYPSSLPVFSWVRVTRSLVLCVCFVNRFLYFFFWPCCISISTCSSGLTNYTILLSTYDNGEIITYLDIYQWV